MIDENGIERESCLVHLKDDVQWTTPDGIFIKGIILDRKGTIVAQHSHEYGHTSVLTRGSVRVWKDGIFLGDFMAPEAIFIAEKVKHKFQALEENTAFYCIHNVGVGGTVKIHAEHILGET